AAEDFETVHGLRVAARRAAAAVDLYADWMPHRQAARWKARLKRIRRVAGAARDADVLVRRLDDYGQVDGIREVVDDLHKQRRKAVKPILRLAKVSDRKDWFGDRAKKMLRQIERRAEWHPVRFE